MAKSVKKAAAAPKIEPISGIPPAARIKLPELTLELTPEQIQQMQQERKLQLEQEIREAIGLFRTLFQENKDMFTGLQKSRYDAGYFAAAALEGLLPHHTQLQPHPKKGDQVLNDICALAWKIGMVMSTMDPSKLPVE